MRHLVLDQGVVRHDPAADAAGREDMAHGEAAQRDRPHLEEAHADVEHPEDVAEQVGVAGQRQDLERDRRAEQHVAGAGDVLERLLGVDESRQQQIQRQYDDGEDEDADERLLDGSPRGRMRRALPPSSRQYHSEAEPGRSIRP